MKRESLRELDVSNILINHLGHLYSRRSRKARMALVSKIEDIYHDLRPHLK